MEQNITTNTQTPTPQIEPAQKMETAEPKKNSSFLVILLSILLIISVLIAGFFAYQTQNLVKEITKLQVIPTPITSTEPIPTTDPTTDWKVHIFSKIGLSIALPEKWYTHKEVLGSPDGGYGSWISYPVDNPSSQSVEVEGLIATLYLFSYENPEKSLDQDATYRLNQPGAEPGTEKFESELGGEKSIILKGPNLIFVLLDHNGIRYYFQLGTEDPNLFQVFDQILSTIKFIESEPTTSPQP